jgi:hypothetical protein
MPGHPVHGAIASPGHCPSALTEGAANFKATPGRSDDVVTTISSRGPTRGAPSGSSDVRRVDNLLEPDFVAPGNAVVSAAAWTSTGRLEPHRQPALQPARHAGGRTAVGQ